LLVGGTVTQQTTDGQGHFEQEIPQDAHEATLVIQGDETPFGGVPFPVKIGDLDPVDEVSGQAARLNNLGYFPGDGTDEDAFLSAVEEFQCDHGLTVDGKCGPLTQAKLKKVHGC
jgi:peptidoglycan hydrolase-like protein with peptidoglycan-binding domain